MNHIISHKRLTIGQVKEIIDGGIKLEIGKEAEEAIVKCRRYLDSKMEEIGSQSLRRSCRSCSIIS